MGLWHWPIRARPGRGMQESSPWPLGPSLQLSGRGCLGPLVLTPATSHTPTRPPGPLLITDCPFVTGDVKAIVLRLPGPSSSLPQAGVLSVFLASPRLPPGPTSLSHTPCGFRPGQAHFLQEPCQKVSAPATSLHGLLSSTC